MDCPFTYFPVSHTRAAKKVLSKTTTAHPARGPHFSAAEDRNSATWQPAPQRSPSPAAGRGSPAARTSHPRRVSRRKIAMSRHVGLWALALQNLGLNPGDLPEIAEI